MLNNISDWIDEVSGNSFIWYVKRLSANDTLANGSHQAGPYIPKDLFFRVFPSLNRPKEKNPDKEFDLIVDSHGDRKNVRAVWYNNKLDGGGTRDEARFTNFGGAASPLLDPEATGALVVFAFLLDANHETKECHVWVCRHETEEDLIEDKVGPVDPGKWKVWSSDQLLEHVPTERKKTSCWLKPEDMPAGWITKFPPAIEIIRKTVIMRPESGFNPDLRLVKRRECEFQIFKSVEEAIELSLIRAGFTNVDEFIAKAQTILQRRKARAGRSLELHLKEILIEEKFKEGVDFSHQPESDSGKSPDFLFPSEKAYKDAAFPERKLRMLAAKTTCRDRWRQIINEADRIKVKHLLTLQEGISENQFKEMVNANVKLVVPEPLTSFYPKKVQPYLQTLESFIGDIRLLKVES